MRHGGLAVALESLCQIVSWRSTSAPPALVLDEGGSWVDIVSSISWHDGLAALMQVQMRNAHCAFEKGSLGSCFAAHFRNLGVFRTRTISASASAAVLIPRFII